MNKEQFYKFVLPYITLTGMLSIVGVLIGASLFLVYLHDNPPITIENAHRIHTDKLEYRYGDTVLITSTFCKKTKASFVVELQLRNEILIPLPRTTGPGFGRGCDTTIAPVMTIPNGIPYGRYRLEAKVSYDVNIFATRVVEWESRWFDVVE